MASDSSLEIATFPSDLGWIALVADRGGLLQLVFAQPSASAALAALDAALVARAREGERWRSLVERLQDFAAGRPVDFRDVPIDGRHLTPYQRRVVEKCRAIPYGQTRSYGELALLAGSPGAARAAGSTMATNRYGLVVPCHRVINADGSPGRYGTPGGTQVKRQLLELERRDGGLPAPPADGPQAALGECRAIVVAGSEARGAERRAASCGGGRRAIGCGSSPNLACRQALVKSVAKSRIRLETVGEIRHNKLPCRGPRRAGRSLRFVYVSPPSQSAFGQTRFGRLPFLRYRTPRRRRRSGSRSLARDRRPRAAGRRFCVSRRGPTVQLLGGATAQPRVVAAGDAAAAATDVRAQLMDHAAGECRCRWRAVLCLLLLTSSVIAARAADPSDQRVGDLTLHGVDGSRPTTEAWRERRAVVLFFLGTECPVSNGYSPELQRIADDCAGSRCRLLGRALRGDRYGGRCQSPCQGIRPEVSPAAGSRADAGQRGRCADHARGGLVVARGRSALPGSHRQQVFCRRQAAR